MTLTGHLADCRAYCLDFEIEPGKVMLHLTQVIIKLFYIVAVLTKSTHSFLCTSMDWIK